MSTDDGTFMLSVTATRKVRVIYEVEHGFHHFRSPDVIGAAYYARDKAKAYAGFVARLQDRVKASSR